MLCVFTHPSCSGGIPEYRSITSVMVRVNLLARLPHYLMSVGSTVRQGVPRPKCIRPVFRLTVVCSIEPMGVWFNTYMHYELAHAQH